MSIKGWVKRFWGLVDRDDYERVWKLWSEAVSTDFRTLSSIQASLDHLTHTNDRLAWALESATKSNRDLLLELSIVNVAPIETMDRALDMLTAVPLEFRPQTSNVGRAILELQHGIDLLRKMPSLKGATNGG